jgi:2,3-dihydroxy-2,3-dihydro-p-cumate dehydrogenase
MKLENQRAVVTGGAQGIGRAIVERLIAEGVQVLVADLERDKAQACADELGAHGAFGGDLSVEAEARALVEHAKTTLGRIDILVNNAGGGVLLPFLSHTAETLQRTLAGNLWTTLWCCHAVLPTMVDQNYGRIVNMGGDSVRNGLWLHAGYNAAKGGVHGLTTGLAREFAKKGITVNCVAPCIVATPGVKPLIDEGENKMVKRMVDIVPMARAADMEEVASAVAYLASPESGFITGQVLSVNGGSTML